MQLPSSGIRAREPGSFRPPGVIVSGAAACAGGAPGVSGDRWFLNCILCQNGTFSALLRDFLYCWWTLFGISVYNNNNIGTGFLEPKIAPEPPPAGILPEDLKKQVICPCNRTDHADPFTGPDIKKVRYLPV